MDAKEGTFYFKHKERILKENKKKIQCLNCGRLTTKNNMYKHKHSLYCLYFKLNQIHATPDPELATYPVVDTPSPTPPPVAT